MNNINENIPTPNVVEVITNYWTMGRHLVRCVKVINETKDVKTFCFMANQSMMFFFKPGQFVTLELEINGQQIMRSYTISSSPSICYSFSITVKRVPGGIVSNWLHDNMMENVELAVHGPAGNFNCIDYPAKKILFLSGGVGITPVMSMARWFFDTNTDVDMNFIHSAQTPSNVIYKRELEYMSTRISNFTLNIICERQETGEAWSGFRGFLDYKKLDIISPDFMEREIFCCGPEPYMEAVRTLLKLCDFDMAHYHEESFSSTPSDIQSQAEEQANNAENSGTDDLGKFQITFNNSDKTINIASSETLHSAAAQLGIHIPKACGMGICGTCKVKKLSGDVIMEHNGGITEEDIEEGYILTCCSTAASDVKLDF